MFPYCRLTEAHTSDEEPGAHEMSSYQIGDSKESCSGTEVINAAWMISAPIVHMGIDNVRFSPRELALRDVCGFFVETPISCMELILCDQLGSLAT